MMRKEEKQALKYEMCFGDREAKLYPERGSLFRTPYLSRHKRSEPRNDGQARAFGESSLAAISAPMRCGIPTTSALPMQKAR